MNEKIAVIGLGYVGLPVALAFAREYPQTVGFDINETRIKELQDGIDNTNEIAPEDIRSNKIMFSNQVEDIKDSNFYVITVPTPIDENRQPDLTPVRKATEMVAGVISKGDIVVYESTVYPGVTEEVCGPILAEISGLKQGVDFNLGYSPERINPGDKEHTLTNITKVVSADNDNSLGRVAAAYGKIINAGIHEAPAIKVAEAAKVIENTQRDLNIALTNEWALIFDKLGIRTADVLEAAGTKWNFLNFTPGLVGGHCIGVDPYYLTAKAEAIGYHPQVILAGRRINDNMGAYIARRLIKLLISADKAVRKSNVAILGVTFKENVNDIRNSRVPDIVNELADFGIDANVHDPLANADEIKKEYNINLSSEEELTSLDAVVLAVPHEAYSKEFLAKFIKDNLPKGGIIVDIKSALNPSDYPNHTYWSL